MNLKPRFFLLTAVLILVSGLGIWLFSQQIVLTVLQEWATRHFEMQVKLEKEHSLQPIIREVALARQFADSQILREWAQDPDDAAKKSRALQEMEAFRQNFADHSYFVALQASGAYYHNNAADEFAAQPYRYTLKADNPDDRWFYSTIEQNRDIRLNVNPDVRLGVTKVWMNVLLRDGDKVLGVVGTGLDLSTYIQQISSQTEAGIENLFLDHNGAIQISSDLTQINFASITKPAGGQKTFWQMLDRPEQRQALQTALTETENHPGDVASFYLKRANKPYLAGIVYLPEIDWYVVTLLDLDELLPLSTFKDLFILAGVCILLALLLFNLALNQHVLRPLRQLERAIETLSADSRHIPLLPQRQGGEIGRLLDHFSRMAGDIVRSREELEARVRQRTEALENLTLTDPLTGLLNRRGMLQRLSQSMNRLEREGERFGIIWLDLDNFKNINDRYGHAAGDNALETTADLLRTHFRLYDHIARWGGDEFLVLVTTPDQQLLDHLGQRICAMLASTDMTPDNDQFRISASVGSCLAATGNSLHGILACADQMLYQAKSSGRNQYKAGYCIE